MIKAIFFDLYHTLIHYHPQREGVFALSLARHGISTETGVLKHAIIAGDEFFYQENARKSLGQRTDTETHALWQEYHSIVLKGAGVTPSPELVDGIISDMRQTTFEKVLFSDVMPAFAVLSGCGLNIGLISNVDQDISPLLNKLGLSTYLGVVLTSKDAGVTKPNPHIFHEAIRRIGVDASDTLYVGDQYQIDVLGARGAGLRALLLDREDSYPDIAAVEKIKSLGELENIVTK